MTLVEQLNEWHRFAAEQMSRDWDEQDEVLNMFRIAFRVGYDAAAEITRLTEENERLREALKPFAELTPPAEWPDNDAVHVFSTGWIATGAFRRARAALEQP